MADTAIANGKFVPLARRYTLSSTPSASNPAPKIGDTKASSTSFYDVLNNSQMSSAQIKSLQQSASQGNTMTGLGQAAQTTSQQTPVFTPEPGTVYTQQQIQEINEQLQNAPAAPTPNDSLANLMVQNMKEYQKQKAQWTADENSKISNPQAALTPVHLPSTVSQTAQSVTAPVNLSPDSSENSPSALSPVSVQPESVESAQPEAVQSASDMSETDLDAAFHAAISTPAAPAETPSPTFPIPAIERPLFQSQLSGPQVQIGDAPLSNVPAYLPADEIKTAGANAQAMTASSSSQQPMWTDLPETEDGASADAENGSQSGFFHAMGSFFGNIFSAATLGVYHPKDEPEATGFMRVIDPVKSVVWDAPKSLLVDAPVGAYHDLTQKKNGTDSAEPASSQASTAVASTDSEKSTRYGSRLATGRHSLRRNFYT